ncbi:MAG: hypothetical protein K2H91_04345 [Lachnospiraceae bacterium]|nr:hypothetical protein [Lachnospiraceae bacterium]
MKVKNLTILLFAAASTLLIGGCTKQNTENVPEAALDLSVLSEDRIEADILSETVDSTSAETITTTVDVTKAFQPNDGWTSDFFFQMPKDWSYTVDEDTFEWGFLIQVNNQEDSSIRIYGQQGTVNVEQFYTEAPTDFETSSGLKGKYYQEKRTNESDTSYVEGDIVFDLKLYGVHFYMPENVYNEYKETLQTIFLSINIEDIIAE